MITAITACWRRNNWSAEASLFASAALLLTLFLALPHTATADDKLPPDPEETYEVTFDGEVLWEIFNSTYEPATEHLAPPLRASPPPLPRFILSIHGGYSRTPIWSYGTGAELRLVNLLFPLTLASRLDLDGKEPSESADLSLGLCWHLPGNLLSSEIGGGITRDVATSDDIAGYAAFGVEFLNLVYGDYQAISGRPDLLHLGLRIYR